jgi:hypothetical protein
MTPRIDRGLVASAVTLLRLADARLEQRPLEVRDVENAIMKLQLAVSALERSMRERPAA